MWSYLTSGNKKSLEDKEVQTVIQRKVQGDISIRPDQEDKIFYSLLEYTPFQDILDSNIRIINLPRPRMRSVNEMAKLNIREGLLFDDDGISEWCLELAEHLRRGGKELQTFCDNDSQTDLHVKPHVLEDDQVACVMADISTQTVAPSPLRTVARKGRKTRSS